MMLKMIMRDRILVMLRKRYNGCRSNSITTTTLPQETSSSTSMSSSSCTRRIDYEEASNGLYGLPILNTPKGFQHFVDQAIHRSGELIAYISKLPPSSETIRAMDEISDTVCSVVDSAELCRNTHPDREYVEEANKASMKIYEYLHFLNTNHTLYKAVVRAEQEGVLASAEAQRAAHSLRIDFEKGGIHLCPGKLDRVNQLNLEITLLGREFSENVIIDPGKVDIFPNTRIPKRIQSLLQPIYRNRAGGLRESKEARDAMQESGFRIVTDPAILSSILKWTPDAEVRKQAYIVGNSVPKANLGVLDKLIAARHELAEILGYKSYAEFATFPNMASSSEVVMSFLHELSEIVKCRADEELHKIREFKRKICGGSSDGVEPWDEAYLTGMMKSSTYDLDSSVIASYFSLPYCLHGLQVMVNSLFGATLKSIPLARGESWHPSVIKMSLQHPQEGDLGYMYLDLYSRNGKYPGCAHFAIKGGRQLSEMNYQLPVVALVCNFSAPYGSSTPRLNHWEVETLFHEFGHALHSLLSRTDYQHFSGTRMVIDLAETPANLFEYYAWDYRVLRTFAKHYSTGDTIPEKLVASMNGAKRMFAATELQRQILFSVMDQTLFGEPTPSPRDTVAIVAELKRQYTSWRHVEGTHWHTRFSHLINYGAGYYSYLYAKCFAATIWQDVCVEDPLSRSVGEALRTQFLQHGGAKDPSHLLRDFVDDGILKPCKGGIVPNTSSLCRELNLPPFPVYR
ncbi:probable mitochondrial intermediate peptidase, mitochondrial isoform X1 [Amborella trichopoda]|nr:probable mitochondrial intermediate peptidase, mitochondrial isoform X1 [Amborella trichopoda]XP_020529271.1 probable mitochondrial intermediate peptidase, mitochondrial isoform X1 [Amborella trichopoda]XP_020529272.1 probable mitochondrial intermediate peptidase, mitochondrial isoform X1 [Amborella trichopoda]XP_020529273.1 probable mitochondrial intermediate peptidase, mitochondrial isoform X1 [Amborella trichopoda]XP_020529274.1 probable mitochondrial intermediate peptidase, mitochondrial|eukprot:XP_006854483.3 probable mitochondrial intermediate peptidase, mitochondrial isoform X1 [Amborella trichopoda]